MVITVKLLHPPLRSSWVVAIGGLTIFVNPVLVIEISSVVYSVVVGISWVTYPYLEGLVFFLSGILILLVVIVFLNMTFIYVLSDSILKRVVPFPRFGIDNRRISRDIANIYYLNFLIGIVFNKVPFLSTP